MTKSAKRNPANFLVVTFGGMASSSDKLSGCHPHVEDGPCGRRGLVQGVENEPDSEKNSTPTRQFVSTDGSKFREHRWQFFVVIYREARNRCYRRGRRAHLWSTCSATFGLASTGRFLDCAFTPPHVGAPSRSLHWAYSSPVPNRKAVSPISQPPQHPLHNLVPSIAPI